jgi:hypothetical protein
MTSGFTGSLDDSGVRLEIEFRPAVRESEEHDDWLDDVNGMCALRGLKSISSFVMVIRRFLIKFLGSVESESRWEVTRLTTELGRDG